mmetsp:Transcript_8911/g.40477  ORF Transcript_8911/g.40477 Transcript_8911/m.40477 type:complete len:217 (-) Transcript_8911:1345-1995(-)
MHHGRQHFLRLFERRCQAIQFVLRPGGAVRFHHLSRPGCVILRRLQRRVEGRTSRHEPFRDARRELLARDARADRRRAHPPAPNPGLGSFVSRRRGADVVDVVEDGVRGAPSSLGVRGGHRVSDLRQTRKLGRRLGRACVELIARPGRRSFRGVRGIRSIHSRGVTQRRGDASLRGDARLLTLPRLRRAFDVPPPLAKGLGDHLDVVMHVTQRARQ